MKNKFLQFLSSMRRGAAMLLLLLTCVTHAWADDSTVKGGDVYFDAGGSGWSVDNVQFVIGHGSYSNREYNMTAVQNTLLYYYSSPSWNDATYFAFASGTSSWSDKDQGGWSKRCGYASKSTTEKSGYGLNRSNVYVFKSNGTGTCDGVESDSPYGWLGTTYSSLNKTITVAAQVSTDGGANYSSASSPGTLTASSYSFTNHGNNCKNSTSLSDGEIICGYTANTTLTAGAATGYTIEGWYDGNGDKLCNNGGTINPREDATVYAYYKLNQYTVSYGVNSDTRYGSITLNSGSSVSTTSSSTLNHGTSISFTASPSSGYQVEGWYSDAACSSNKKLQPGGTSYNAGTLTAATTVYVKFEVRTGGTVTLTAGTGGQVSLDNSNWGASKAKSEITTATAFNIYAQASTGYTFSAWAKSSGSGTITSTSSASTTFTPVAYEDATVTASFTERMSTLTTSCAYDAGTPGYSVPSKSVSSIGIATTADVTATAPGTGYTFAGWTLTHCVRTDDNGETSRSITIRSDGSGSAATAQANYEEDLTSTYYLVGNNLDVFPGDKTTWKAEDNNMLRKASGSSTGSVGSITINVKSIPANSDDYQFKIHESSANKWWGWSNDYYYWMDDTKTTSLYDNQHNLYFIPNALGDYTFSTDWSNADEPSLTVTFPATTYTVNFGQGAGTAGTASATYSSTSFTSGTKVQNDKSITLTAPSASSGYTWDGWYNASSGGSKVSSSNPLTTTISSSNHDFYARYTEDTHTVTLANGGHGHVEIGGATVTSVSGVGIATASGTITAVPDPGYYFTGWTGAINSGVTLASGTASSASITINATADSKTITANFKPRFALNGSLASDDSPGHGMPGWEFANAADFEVKSFTGLGDDGVCLQCTCTLDPNTTYKFRVLDRKINNRRGCNAAAEPANVLPAGSNWKLNYTEGSGAQDVRIKTVGRGTYIFHITNLSDDGNEYPSIQVERQASHLVSLGQGYVDIDGGTHSSSTTGGTISAEATESGITVGITNGQYIANGGKLEWAPDPAAGYTLSHYYGASDFSGDSFDFTTINPVSEAANVYAKFVETSTAVTIAHNEHGHVTVGGATATSTTVGITTTRALVAVPDAGYYFAGWSIEGSDIELQDKSDDEDTEVTLHGLGAGTAATLTANFVEEDKIYFRNIDQSTGEKLWDKDHIYVYFGTTWYDGKGVQTLSNYAEMSPFGSTKIYWAYVPHAFTKSKNTHVAFSDVDMHSNSEFYNNKGVYRTDYSRITNMFVPHHTTSGTTNGTVYHSNGYWKVFDPQIGVGQGYYLQLHTGVDGEGKGTYDEKGEFTAVANGSSKIAYTMRVDNTSTQRTYRIVSAGGVHYTASTTITSAACTDVTVIENSPCSNCYFTVTPTSEGNYTFIIDQSEDYMKLTVDYPVSVGDYRLKNSYNDGAAKNTYSDIIKSNDASTSRTLSMYLNTAGTETLVLQKCTAIVAGVPVWDAGDDTNLGGILTTVGSNPGVYQFDVSVSADKVSSAPTATKYVGPYYIKTDGASGGWVNYKQNFMDENTLNYDTNHPEKSFNYYYCKYYNAEGNNLKCVIANDYCNALTDTLIGDDVLGVLDAKPRQTTPSAVSVRFSYNSYTNEIKRSYLGASMEDDFLRIEGNTTASAKHIYDKDETTFNDGNADSYIKFEDKQNWRYEIIIKADANARAKLTASFNGQTQYFMGAAGEFSDENTEQLFGGESGTYGLTLVYDFKTNKLIRAWKPTGSTISENLTLESDVLLLREHQGAPAAITFGTIGETDVYASLTDVKTVYSVLRLNRWKLSNRAHPEDVDTEHCKTADLINDHHPALSSGDAGYLPQAERELYFISFPYDVKMSDIIHFGGYYDKWGIMYYDGKGRAKNGYWIDSESNWKYFTPEEFATKTLKAYEGYLIGIDLAAMRYDNTSFWTHNSSEVDIYFPSKEPVSTITQQAVDVSIDQEGYQCTINREFGGSDGDRRIKDSYWHCIGVPAYANLDHAITGSEPTSWENKNLLYLYEWNTATNDHSIEKASDFSFQAMYAYLVQYAGTTLSWAAAAVSPATPAARRMKTEELRDRQFNLQLMQGDKETDHTYIRLSDDEEVTAGFEFNHDVSKMMLSGANIYTLIGTEQAAANSLPLNLEQTTVVPVGVKIATAGDYTFAIPEGTDGVGVVLIDNIAGTRTNLALTDYTVSLTTGKIENRFTLEISPIQQTPTDVELLNGANGENGVRKVMIDGLLYIVKDGKVYDAQGKRVQ